MPPRLTPEQARRQGLRTTPAEGLSQNPAVRPWLGVRFLCAGAYLRAMRVPDGSHYLARCPSCGDCVRFRIGAQGTPERFFEVDCR